MNIENDIFGHLPSGERVYRILLKGGGLTASVLTWGSVIQDLRMDGHEAPLVLGFDSLEDYLEHSPYFGASPGRNANRIGGGRFSIDGKDYQLERNEKGVTHLHGGSDGLGKRNWSVKHQSAESVTLEITDPDGRAGYPGNCRTLCTYTLKDGGLLAVTYESQTDRATICNVCQHSYFNLDGRGDTLDHLIVLDADHYLPTDALQIPTGEIAPVTGTVFDLRTETALRRQQEGGRISYDHNFCLSPSRTAMRRIATVRSPHSGISLSVSTTEPGVQLYTAPSMNIPVPGLEGRLYGPFAGFCLETQNWPDAVNHPGFPNAILRPGETLRQETEYRFTRA